MDRLLRRIRGGSRTESSLAPPGQASDDTIVLANFRNAILSFRQALSDEDRQQFCPFENPESMIKDLESHIKKLKENRKLLAGCQVVRNFAKSWSPFFDIVTLFSQCHPEWASLAWGAIRLVFLLSSNYATFFEKLVEMLERIALRLPSYAEHLERFRRGFPPGSQTRLVMAMSYVYADILQFCQDACKIFTTKRGGARHTISVVRDLFWKPFDVRFGDLLERLRDHQELFDIELRIENHKALEILMRKIEGEVFQIKLQLQDERMRGAVIKQDRESLRSCFREIKKWISPPDFMYEFETARRNRFPGTGTWLLEDYTYISWKNTSAFTLGGSGNPYGQRLPFLQRVLTLQANPGFGKTTLSTLLIEDLKTESVVTQTSRPTPSVAFFHFDSRRPEKREHYDAFRAIIVQLIQKHQMAADIIDTISILMDTSGSGQPRASDDEIQEIFTLLIRRIPDVILVLDGIDECANVTQLLRTIYDICNLSTCKILLLGRPNISFPQPYRQGRLQVELKPWSNLNDLKDYLRAGVGDLLGLVDISGGFSVIEIADMIANRAQSMFLFAKLMIAYLQSPALSPSERMDEIKNLSLIEGLDDMYERTTQALESRFRKEKKVVFEIFRLLSLSLRPLTVDELRTALAINPGKPTDKSNCLQDFEQSVLLMCGALVEIRPDRTVNFVHISAKEFLTSETAHQKRIFFYIDPNIGHLHTSKLCLSYLTHDMPAGPLGGSPNKKADPDHLEGSLPLLRYATQSWAQHIAQGVRAPTPESLSEVTRNCQDLGPYFSAFLLNQSSVSAWIEASWMFGAGPSISDLLEEIAQLDGRIASVVDQRMSFFWFCKKLDQLSIDLTKLNQEWSQLLRVSPNEIWGSSVSAFNKSDFWVNTKATVVSSLIPLEERSKFDSNDLRKPLLSVSKLSSDGTRVGIVDVWQPISWSRIRQSEERSTEASPSLGFSVRYRLCAWDVDVPSLVNMDIEIPQYDSQQLEQQHLEDPTSNKFRFPIAFSSDLRQLAILRSVVRVAEGNTTYPYRTQVIDLSPPHVPSLGHHVSEEEEYPSWYRLLFSPNGKYIAVAKRRGRPEVVRSWPWGVWSLTVWKEDCLTADNPNFQAVAEIRVHTTNLLKDGYVVFHPHKPVVAVSGDIETVIWNFADVGPPRKRTIFRCPLQDMKFSPDGHFLYGVNISHGNVIIKDLRPFMDNERHVLELGFHEEDVTRRQSLVHAPNLQSFMVSLARHGKPAVQEANTITTRDAEDGPEMSMIKKYDGVGAVVHKRLRRCLDRTDTLAFLPKSTMDTNVSLLEPIEDQEWLRLVLTNEPKESYTFNDPSNVQQPRILKRKQCTIVEYDEPRLLRKRLRLEGMDRLTPPADQYAPTGEYTSQILDELPDAPDPLSGDDISDQATLLDRMED